MALSGRHLASLLLLATPLLLVGCTIKTVDDDSTPKGQAGAGQAGSGQAGSGQAGSGEAGSGQAGSGQAGSGTAGSGTAGSGTAGSGQAGSGTAGSDGGDPCGGVPASGRCVDAEHYERCQLGAVPIDGGAATPEVVKGVCQAGTTCKQQGDWSGCVPTSECAEGATYCDGAATRVVCAGGSWQKQACAIGEECKLSLGGSACENTASQAGQTFTIQGKLLYEYRPVREDRTGYGDPTPDSAKGVIALAYDGDEYLGGAYTSGEDGSFAIEVPQKPTSATSLFFIPMLYDDGGVPQFAVAVPDSYNLSNLTSSRYYSYTRATGDKLDVGEILITEAEGSPAINIHQWVLYSILQLRQSLPDAKPFNVVALWAPNGKFGCGNGTCYAPRGYGAKVDYGSGSDFYEGALLLAGTEETPHQHSTSVILHEFGHYAMEAYSRSPHEATTHTISMPEPPGQAWSEGWATYLGQSMKQDTIYFDKQEGSTWYYDVSKPYADKVDPNGPIDQQISESNVSHMLWSIEDAENDDTDQCTLGQTAVIQAFGSKRMTDPTYNRGYKTIDFVDMLDALRCQNAPADALLSVTQSEGYPYDNAPTCAP